MPSVVLSTEADVATWSSGIAAGAGDHLPVGYWSSAVYRSAMRFPQPAWGAWTNIVSATLEFSISDHSHVGVRNSGIYIRQQSSGAVLWTKAEGTQDCESGFSGSNTTQYDDLVATSANQVSFSSGTTANARKSVNVTAMVKSYFANNRAKLVFIFDPMDSNDYTELWSRTSPSNAYDAKLTIVYENAAPPLAPTLVAPAAGGTIEDTTPNFSWTHNDPDPQTAADVELYDAAGTTLLHTYSIATAANNLDGTDVLPRGVNYQWRARTYDAVSGVGAWSALRTFTLRALPVVTISTTRRMVFANGAPRLQVAWTSDQPQTHYRVQSSAGYDSGWVAGSDVLHTLSTQAVVSGTAQTLTVSSRSSFGALEGSASQAFTPRYGLSTHRKDLTTAPLNWGTPVITQTVPADTQLVIEYGSDPAANAVPASGWLSSLSAAPFARYLFYRAWLIPSAVAGPTLDKIIIPVDSTVTLVDKWGTTKDTPGLTAPWSVDTGEAVYGTRSLRADVTGAGPFKVYSYKVSLRAGRSYILTGLMKSQGNSGAQFRLEDSAGAVLIGGGMSLPVGNVESVKLTADQQWYNAARNDTVRYRTPVYVAAADMDAYVVLLAGGTNGAKCWFDALKLEESTVATPWSPAAIGAVVIDAGGVQVDGTRGGVIRYKGSTGGARDTVEGGPKGLTFGGDTELTSPATGVLAVDGVALALGLTPIVRVYSANATWTKPAGLRFATVEVIGGGGGTPACATNTAGNSTNSSGGGAGGYAKKLFDAAALPASCTVTVPAASTTGGGTCSFAGAGITTVQATGGAAGTVSATGSTAFARGGGDGGIGSGGDINVHGGPGVNSGRFGGLGWGGNGGNSVLGGGGQGGATATGTASIPGDPGGAYGAGAGGAVVTGTGAATSAIAGAVGVVIVTEYY